MFRSWRLASVALQSLASGLPLGLVWIAIPTWMTQAGVDIKVVGLFTLAQAPWTFKFLWAPLMDRYPPPFMGRKRGWIFIAQLALLGLGLWLAGVSDPPIAVGLIGLTVIVLATALTTPGVIPSSSSIWSTHELQCMLAMGIRTFAVPAPYPARRIAVMRSATRTCTGSYFT